MNISQEFLTLLVGVAALGAHAVGLVWWGSKIDARVKRLEDETNELKVWRHDVGVDLRERMAVLESKFGTMLGMLDDMKKGAGR